MSYKIIYKGDIHTPKEYTYTCSCGKILTRSYKMSEDIPFNVPCECGLEASRSLMFNRYSGRHDPSSHNYWAKNLSPAEQAKVYSNEREPY
jgi:hypothetical protein